MVKETIDGIYRQTNLPNESAEYLAKREEVRLAEIELRNARERVAELRRALPKGATIQDYEFLDCSIGALPNSRATARYGRVRAAGDSGQSDRAVAKLAAYRTEAPKARH